MKKPIRILSLNMDILGEIDNYESMFFNRSWHGIGSIELRINRYKKYADTLLKNNLILIGTDLNKVFMIKHREIELDENGKITENWLIKGYALKSIVAQRITMPPAHTSHDNKSGNAETVMKHYINANLVNPVDSKRKIPQLVIAPNLQRGAQINHASRFKNLAEEMSTLSLTSGLGWDVTLNIANKQWVFDVIQGHNLVASQSVLPPVIFSPQFDSLKSLHYTQSELNYKNVAIVAGQGEGVDRRVIEVGNYSAINRHEIFIDARDVAETDDNEQPIPPQQIIQALTDRGQQQLSELIQEEYLEGQILMGTRSEKVPILINGVAEDVRLEEVDLRENRNLFSRTTEGYVSPWGSWDATGVTNEIIELKGSLVASVKLSGRASGATNAIYRALEGFEVGKDYSLSVYARIHPDSLIKSGNLNIYINGYVSKTLGTEWSRIDITQKAKKTKETIHITQRDGAIIYQVALVKLEKSSTATPWQPAPEDNVSWYQPTKTIELNPINLNRLGRYQSSHFNYDIDTLPGTSLSVEYSLDKVIWNPLHSGGSLPFNEGDWLTDKVLYLRQTLYTTDQSVTPTIKNFRYDICGYSTKETITTATFQYEVDYDLGDITTVQNLDWGVTMDARITDIKEIYETNGFAIEATFGNNRPTLIQKIKQELNQISGEIRK